MIVVLLLSYLYVKSITFFKLISIEESFPLFKLLDDSLIVVCNFEAISFIIISFLDEPAVVAMPDELRLPKPLATVAENFFCELYDG